MPNEYARSDANTRTPVNETDPPPVFVVGYDFSPCAEAALTLAIKDLEPGGRGTVRVVHALKPTVSPGGFDLAGASPTTESPAEIAAEIRGRVGEELEARLGELRSDYPELRFEGLVVEGEPDTVLLDQAARNRVDRLVVGTHGRRGLTHLLLGSVAERIVRMAPCSVLVAKPAEGGELSYPDEA